ncbi:sorbosone dehydrogenase [Sphingobacteriaceae bacterium]|nr:sorbosone dehydrogenase [Sphingobacteriaceae bacterium]
MQLKTLSYVSAFALASLFVLPSCNQDKEEPKSESLVLKADADNAGLTLPAGFGALKVADEVGPARHLAITPEGHVFIKLAYPDKDGNGIVFLKAKGNDYTKIGFAPYGGTGIFLKDNYLYASSNTDVYRYKLNEQHEPVESVKPEKIVSGLIDRHQHESKSIALDNAGNIYVNIGAFSNSCQQKDRENNSPGIVNCPVLDSAAGIWQFKADKQDQHYGDGQRYATGLRNVVGLDWNTEKNSLFVMQHGRDQLTMFPDVFDAKKNAELPAECMFELKKGDNCGWPYSYYDPTTKKKILNPEYGGDGKKEVGNEYIDPVAAYPAHMAPNGLLFYTGSMFPEKYKNGAFIAFHGSWNRAPEPQAGFFVVFQPFKDGKPSGDWEIFADGFSGSKENSASGKADHRPCGLAQGPDGSIYVSDDSKGRIYRIIYTK